MLTIRLPKLLTIGWSNGLLTLCARAIAHKGPTTFDFSKVEWAAPFGLTVISITLEKCLLQRKELFYTPPSDAKLRKYLERIGFHFLFLRGRPVSHRQSSLELRSLRGVDPGCSEALVDLIGYSLRLSDDAKYEMRTHLNELMTNGFDHSESRVGCYVCAQWYPSKRDLRISFADGGVGILSALKSSGKFPSIKTDADAIRLAVKPGVTSRKKHIGGFGLDYIKKYVRNNEGTLTIISGHSKVNFYANKIEHKPQPTPFEGTIVDIKASPKMRGRSDRRLRSDLF